jgi:DNA mismatch repair protein MutL
VADLFFNQPARRRFLKSPRGETSACRRVFLEKAAAHPDVTFRLFLDGTMRNFLPAGTRIERLTAAWPDVFQGTPPKTVRGSGPGFTFDAVVARPELSRKDRRYLQVYANRRRIDEFSLTKALELGFDPFLPGGVFPVAFLFLEVEPHLVDFNIHPAKKEARFRDPSAIRHRVIDEIRAALTDWAYKERPAGLPREAPHGSPYPAADRRPLYRTAVGESRGTRGGGRFPRRRTRRRGFSVK